MPPDESYQTWFGYTQRVPHRTTPAANTATPRKVPVSSCVLTTSILDGLGIEGPLSTRVWADRYRVVKGGPIADRSPDGKCRWSTNNVPHAAGIMDAVDNPEIDTVVVEGCTRLAKSEAGIVNPMLKDLADGRPVLYVNSSREMCVTVWMDKLQPAIEATPALRRWQLGDKDGGQMMHRVFGNGAVLYMAGAGQIPAGFDAPRVYCDEINKPGYDRKKGQEVGTLHLAAERSDGYERGRKLVMVCTVTTPGGRITTAYSDSDQRLYYVPCPHCGGWQVMEFSQGHASAAGGDRYPDWDYPHGWLLFDDTSAVKAKQTARYVCGCCGAEVPEEQKTWMVRSGLWVRRGCAVEVEAVRGKKSPPGQIVLERPPVKSKLPARFIVRECGTPAKETTKAGFHYNAMLSLITTWGTLASGHVRARNDDDPDALKSWQRSRLAITWEDQDVMDKRSWGSDFIRQHATPYYARTLPPEAFERTHPPAVITMGADVHAAAIYYTFRAWAMDGTSWLLEAGVISVHHMARADDAAKQSAVLNALDRLWEAFDAGFEVAPGKHMRVSRGYLDEGWEQAIVREACRRTGRLGLWMPVKGAGGMARKWRESQKDCQTALTLAVDRFKHVLVRLMERSRRRDGESLVVDPGYWHVHENPHHDYCHQMASEEWRPKKNKQGSDVDEWEWGLVSGHNNHWWDTEVYATAAALSCKVPVHRVGTVPGKMQVPPTPRSGMGEPRRATASDYGNRKRGWTIGR